MFVGDWLLKRSMLTPFETAVREAGTGKRWTYEQLNKRAVNLAAYFLKCGIAAGDRIALKSVNHISYFDFLFACYKIGAIFVPLNWRLSAEELKYIVADCGPKLIGIKEEASNGAQALAERMLKVDSDMYEELVNEDKTLPIAVSEDEDLPVLIIYTGGTTGKPKGVVLSRRSLLANSLNTIASWGINNEDITLNYMPMFHTGGINALTLPILVAGGTVIYGAHFDAEEALNYLNHYACTIALFVPTMYHSMIASPYFKSADFPTMKAFLSGGAPCPLEIYKSFKEKGLPFKEGYGLTEAGPNNFFITPSEAILKAGSVGKPMLLNNVRLFDGEKDIDEADQVGELLINGEHTFVGYWKNQQATNDTLQKGWLHTGDLAKYDHDGYYYIVGRKKDMIISGGENIYPIEVEQVLLSHPSVEEASVIGIKDEKWGEIVIAFIVASNPNATKEVILNHCKGRLAQYKLPKQIHFIEEMPKTAIGKIDKVKLCSAALFPPPSIG